mmetsp:Transcript_45938/g.147615  ORF Transcript_45938/g.147615 Transcript_45938/m.147615 type:complete len:377 (-) Transcript_45938:1263-2393(-)
MVVVVPTLRGRQDHGPATQLVRPHEFLDNIGPGDVPQGGQGDDPKPRGSKVAVVPRGGRRGQEHRAHRHVVPHVLKEHGIGREVLQDAQRTHSGLCVLGAAALHGLEDRRPGAVHVIPHRGLVAGVHRQSLHRPQGAEVGLGVDAICNARRPQQNHPSRRVFPHHRGNARFVGPSAQHTEGPPRREVAKVGALGMLEHHGARAGLILPHTGSVLGLVGEVPQRSKSICTSLLASCAFEGRRHQQRRARPPVVADVALVIVQGRQVPKHGRSTLPELCVGELHARPLLLAVDRQEHSRSRELFVLPHRPLVRRAGRQVPERPQGVPPALSVGGVCLEGRNEGPSGTLVLPHGLLVLLLGGQILQRAQRALSGPARHL